MFSPLKHLLIIVSLRAKALIIPKYILKFHLGGIFPWGCKAGYRHSVSFRGCLIHQECVQHTSMDQRDCRIMTHWHWSKLLQKRGFEMLLWLKHLICKHGTWVWSPPNHVSAKWMWQPTCSSSFRRQRQGIPRTSRLARLAILTSSEFDWKTPRQWIRWKMGQGWFSTPASDFHILVTHHTHTHTCPHTCKCAYIYGHYTYTKEK